jgi:hypothetical protein
MGPITLKGPRWWRTLEVTCVMRAKGVTVLAKGLFRGDCADGGRDSRGLGPRGDALHGSARASCVEDPGLYGGHALGLKK